MVIYIYEFYFFSAEFLLSVISDKTILKLLQREGEEVEIWSSRSSQMQERDVRHKTMSFDFADAAVIKVH